MRLFELIVLILILAQLSECELDCGVEGGGSSRIFHGTKVRGRKYPWLVKVVTSGAECTGSIIDSRHVITADHCTRSIVYNSERTGILSSTELSPSQVTVVVGTDHIDSDNKLPRQYSVRVSNILRMVNEDDGDIAILKLANKLRFSNTISPVCIPEHSSILDRASRVVVAGWGLVEGFEDPTDLHEGGLDLLREPECESYLASENIIPVYSNFVCAVDPENRVYPCSGDSGAPMMWKNPDNGRWYLLGVHSESFRDCQSTAPFPVVFANVALYARTFIEAVVPGIRLA